MDDTIFVRVIQSLGQLDADIAGVFQTHSFAALKHGEKRTARDILHDEEGRTFVFGNVEYGDDSRMRESSRGSCFSEEPVAKLSRRRAIAGLDENLLDR